MKGFRLDLSSTRLALVLIALLVLMILISVILPQEEPGGSRIRNSPFFLAVLGLLAVNLAAGNIKRFRTIRQAKETVLRIRHLGSVVFHLALLLIILGVILNSLYRFNGVFGLTEGQTLRDVPQDYFRVFAGPLSGDAQGRFSITLDRVDREYPVGDALTEAALVRVQAGGEERNAMEAIQGAVHINHPLRWRDLEFHLGSTTGFSPEVVVSDATGKELFHSFVRLKTQFLDGTPFGEDFLHLPAEDLEIRIRVEQGAEQGHTPTCRLLVKQGSVDLFAGIVSDEEPVVAGPYLIAVPRLRSWCYVHAVSNPWLGWVFAGFWICLTGLAIRAFAQMIEDRRPRG